MVAKLTESFSKVAFDAEIADGIAEEAADKELKRKVVHDQSVTQLD